MSDYFVVRVEDRVNASLVGHGGTSYTSPAQPRAQALALVRVLLGRAPGDLGTAHHWVTPMAGGRRVVELIPATEDGQTSLDV